MKWKKGPPKSPGWFRTKEGPRWWDGRYWSKPAHVETQAEAAKVAKNRMPYAEQRAVKWAAIPRRRSDGV